MARRASPSAVIPAALFGTREVLPIGARYPRRSRVDVVFGEPLIPDPLLPRGKRIADLTRRSETAVHALYERARKLSARKPSADSARAIALMAEEAFERSFDLGDTTEPKARREQGSLLLDLALAADPECLETWVGRARLAGLRATEGSVLLRLPRAFAVRRGAVRALRRDPDNLMASYIIGRWHLSVPRALGGRPEQAAEYFARAELLGSGDTRYAMAPAEALTAVGRSEEAVAAYDRVIGAEPADPRSADRRQRAVQARAALAAPHAVPALEPAPATPAPPAGGSDFDAPVKSSVPLVVLTVALLSLLILTFAFRSVLLPLLALAFNVLVVGGSLGFLALTSASGDHVINSVTPLMLFAVMFGLSMDYMVVMISRMREEYLAGNPHRQAVAIGVSRTAGLVNGAAVIMVAVFLAFLSAQISVVRELGVSLAAAVLLDALVIRRLVMPATMLLLGRRVWGRARPNPAVAAAGAEAAEPVSSTGQGDSRDLASDAHLR